MSSSSLPSKMVRAGLGPRSSQPPGAGHQLRARHATARGLLGAPPARILLRRAGPPAPRRAPGIAVACAPPEVSVTESVGGAPTVERLLERTQPGRAGGGGEEEVVLTLADLDGVYPFELDDFQLEATAVLLDGLSVVVSAPTVRRCKLNTTA